VEMDHRHYDQFMVAQPQCKRCPARWKSVPSTKRRLTSRLGVARTRIFEPIGQTRETFCQQKLVFGLVWFSDSASQLVQTGAAAKTALNWLVKWARPASLSA
jgi:hypothetical protein